MLDEEWLRELRFSLGDGYALEGIFVGGNAAVFAVTHPDGYKEALRIFERSLLYFPSWIREVPNWMVSQPLYDVDRLNRKLGNLVGDPRLHLAVRRFKQVYDDMLRGLAADGITELASITVDPPEFQPLFRWFLLTPGFRAGLDRMRSDKDETAAVRTWAEDVVAKLTTLSVTEDDLAPESLHDNPLLYWAGAVLEGFFTFDELPLAAVAARTQLDAIPSETATVYIDQLEALLWGLSQVGHLTERVLTYCDELDVFDRRLADSSQPPDDDFGRLLEAAKRPRQRS
jgi:hypothetical protein